MGGVGAAQDVVAVFLEVVFDVGFAEAVVEAGGGDDLAGVGGVGPVKADVVAVKDAGVGHGVALHSARKIGFYFAGNVNMILDIVFGDYGDASGYPVPQDGYFVHGGGGVAPEQIVGGDVEVVGEFVKGFVV